MSDGKVKVKPKDYEYNYQNVTNYKPSRAECRLLDVLLDPGSRRLTITDICKKAGTCRPTYYKAMDNEEFVNLLKEASKGLLNKHLGTLVNVAIREAIKGNFAFWKECMEMSGMKDKPELIIKMTATERDERLAELLAKAAELNAD